MRTSTAHNHLARLSGRLHDAYDFARRGGWSHARLLEALDETVWSDPAVKRCPGWVRDKLSERSAAALRALYRPDLYASDIDPDTRTISPHARLQWLVGRLFLDGRVVTSDEVCAIREAGDEEVWQRVTGTYVWTHNGNHFSPDTRVAGGGE